MLAFAFVGTNDLEKARGFYTAVLGEMGATLMREGITPSAGTPMMCFGRSAKEPALFVTTPANGEAAIGGNGMMIALSCTSADEARRVHAKAIELGGTDEGAPGPRGAFFCAYFRDPEGNKFNAFCAKPE